MSRQNVEDIYTLAPAQQSMLLYLLLGGDGSEIYFEQWVATLEGDLDLPAWRQAWRRVVARHAALRTLFLWERRDRPLQAVRREVELPWQELDWTALTLPERERRLAAYRREDQARGFDLRKAPLLRVAVIRWSADAWRLVWSFSHLILDGWSIAVVLREVLVGYHALSQGGEPGLEPARPYRDFVAWLQRQDLAGAESFWRRALAGFSAPTPLPFDGSGDGREKAAGWASAQEALLLDEAETGGLRTLARRHRVTLNTVLQGAWALLLGRLAGGDDVLFGGVVSGRPPEVAGIESMVGLFVNALPVRVRIDAASAAGPWLRELQERQSEQRQYEHCPLEQIHAWSEVDRRTPLFDSLLVFENYPTDGLEESGRLGLRVRDVAFAEAQNYPLSLFVSQRGAGLELRIAYHRTRFSAAAARRLLDSLAALLRGLRERPEERLGELPLLSAPAVAELLAAGSGPRSGEAGDACMHELVAAAAARFPDAVAVEQGELCLTYAELARRAGRLGRRLRRLGVGPEAVVGLAVLRSPEMLVGMLGVLEAGGAYLPLDPGYPPERLALMMADSGLSVVLSQRRLAERLGLSSLVQARPVQVVHLDAGELAPGDPHAGGTGPAAARAAAATAAAATAAGATAAAASPGPAGLERRAVPENPAYVIYTSGSTGRPKGVLVPHAALVNYVRHAAAEYGIGPGGRVLQFASIGFDTSAEEIYPCLAAGATLVLRDEAMIGSADRFLGELRRLRIGVADLPTAYWHELAAEMDERGLDPPEELRLVIIGGEEALAGRLAAWRRRVGVRVRLVNTYGPTEATIVTTSCDLTAGPAGRVDQVLAAAAGGPGGQAPRAPRALSGAGEQAPAALALPSEPGGRAPVAPEPPSGPGGPPPRAPARLPIGRAVPGARTYVLDRRLDLLPAGIDGELCIGGAGLARGYLGRPDLTAERFVPDPFAPADGAAAGERLYRTGDLARLLPDGTLEFRGRADTQVKVRGFRVELGEIEAALRRLPEVREAAAALDGEPGAQRLVAWVAVEEARGAGDAGAAGAAVAAGPARAAGGAGAAGAGTAGAAALRAALERSLPGYMIPAAFVVLPALPRTPSGKLDRRALPAPDAASGDLAADYAAPRGPVEEVAAGFFAELLGVERAGAGDDFFKLGGHSLLVAKLVARVRQAFGVELSLPEVFNQPTVAGLAAAIAGADRDRTGGGLPELPPIRRAPRDRPIPLSFPQERVWFLDRLTPGGNVAYNFQVTIWLRGPLDAAVLRRALTEIVRRHEVLRTSFPAVDGQPVQVVHPPGPVALPVVDLRRVPEPERQELAERLFGAAAAVPFDVARAPLIRWRLLRLEDELWELIQVEHHFVHDGWSFALLLSELRASYPALLRGGPSPLPEPAVQYADFAVWQRQWMAGPVMERLLDFWQAELAGAPNGCEISTDRPRPARPSFAGDVELLLMPPELYDALRTASRREGFTLYMTMLAGFFALLGRYTGGLDLVIGTSNANRRARELEGMIGMVVNTLLLRGDLAGNPAFRELLGRVRELTLEVYAHQDMPFERLVRELRPERRLGRNPLFQIMYNFHDAAVPDLEFGGLEARFLVRGNRSAKMDMNVIVVPRAEQRVGLAGREADRRAVLHWEYSTDLFDRSTILRMVDHYLTLLRGAVEDPRRPLSELPLLTAGERRELLAAGGQAESWPVADGETLDRCFAAQAGRRPDAVAVSMGERWLTYGELNRRAGRLAGRLRRLGVGPEARVGLAVERSPELIVGLLGILQAGGAYVPLDPGYPPDRLRLMVEDSAVAAVVVDRRRPEGFLPDVPENPLPQVLVDAEVDAPGDPGATGTGPAVGTAAPAVGGPGSGPLLGRRAVPEQVAYVIYTSGSTGKPKGVPVMHANVVRLMRATERRFGFAPDDVWTLFHSYAFDFSVWEIWGALLYGGRLAVVPWEVSRTPEAFHGLLAAEGVTVLNQTPSAFAQLQRVDEEPARQGALASLRWIVFGGEALQPSLLAGWFDRHGDERPRLVNMYGITETTVHVTWRLLRAADARDGPGSPIGRAIADLSLRLLDPDLNLVPAGVPGEIHVGGAGLARGYLNRPELTAERFIPDPFAAQPGARLYRSGDLARLVAGGELEVLGRRDQQVKVRGHRIELGEIETALARHPAVREAVVVARGGGRAGAAVAGGGAAGAGGGETWLAAYLVAAPGHAAVPGAAELRRFLAASLPEPMIPAAFMFLEALPLTVHGKVDRKALPDPAAARSAPEESFVAPASPVEETLAAIWCEVLEIDRPGVHDDFFLLGGHSLSAARILSRVRDRLRAELSLAALFEAPTIAGLAAALEAAGAPAPSTAPMPSAVPASAAALEPARAAAGAVEEKLLAQAAELPDAELDALLARMMTTEGERV
jgi:amino acid adenylation domain-containing protein